MSTEKKTAPSLGEWYKELEERDRRAAEESRRAVRWYAAMARQREERENRERRAAWEARQAQERAEAERAAAVFTATATHADWWRAAEGTARMRARGHEAKSSTAVLARGAGGGLGKLLE
jgi:hypothetical protein